MTEEKELTFETECPNCEMILTVRAISASSLREQLDEAHVKLAAIYGILELLVSEYADVPNPHFRQHVYDLACRALGEQ